MRTPVSGQARPNPDRRPFSLGLYLTIVCAFSWPFQLAFVFLGESLRPILLVSMVMAGVGTFVSGRYVFKDGHAPFIVTMGLQIGGRPEVSVPLVLAVSLIPTVMHAIVFAYLWSVSGSLLVATVYHSAFDEVRDTLQQAVGFGVLAENWQAVVLTILGALLLWKVSWTTGRS